MLLIKFTTIYWEIKHYRMNIYSCDNTIINNSLLRITDECEYGYLRLDRRLERKYVKFPRGCSSLKNLLGIQWQSF